MENNINTLYFKKVQINVDGLPTRSGIYLFKLSNGSFIEIHFDPTVSDQCDFFRKQGVYWFDNFEIKPLSEIQNTNEISSKDVLAKIGFGEVDTNHREQEIAKKAYLLGLIHQPVEVANRIKLYELVKALEICEDDLRFLKMPTRADTIAKFLKEYKENIVNSTEIEFLTNLIKKINADDIFASQLTLQEIETLIINRLDEINNTVTVRDKV